MASSAVQDVQKRIQTMNDAIYEHTKAIKELKKQKHAAWVGPEYADLKPHAYTAPMLLMRICRSWTQIALATPSLWTDIHIHIAIPYVGFGNLFEIWLDRTQLLPVKISLSGGRHPDVEDVITKRAGQFVELEVSVEMDELRAGVGPRNIANLVKTPFLALEKVALGSSRLTHHQWPGLDACLAFIHNAPRLTECTLFRWAAFKRFGLWEGSEDEHEPRIHPCLRRLHLGGFYPKCTADVLRYLTLPALEFLHISAFDIKLEEFAAFFARSGASLQTLRLAAVQGEFGTEYRFQTDGISLCRLVPRLQNLYISFGEYETTFPFFNALCTELGFLPNIVSLTVRVRWPEDLSILCDKLRDVLSARRSKSCHTKTLQSFKMVPVGLTDRGYPRRGELGRFETGKAQICASLETLVEDGMALEVEKDVEAYM
ncbi:hypothetical protein FB45DRAFT_1135234 [Roridomyces roridus]|uniref:F-box domain-containing protein n=1 Tax=Roridomyces roridus TaxID=1738132 RepID=A0AAD7FS07_9AGAR|nr:hypothetical protein FB45DRAFT_1135234 [Roridomyces roridus]